ncbi:MAG: complex I NDUFA9 subunit family protein [Alphaproteobacteria bacterium]|nr:complex I NDUFA9 subunit family protein [Alphaproteobacteria bacterium]
MARLATIFGGSGFIGRYVVRQLARDGWRINVAVRDAERAKFLKPMGDVGQVTPMAVSLRDKDAVAGAVAGADAVVNLVGILYESGRQSFEAIHHQGAGTVAEAAAGAGAGRLVHVSALGADPASPALYARTKAAGEAAVRAAFPGATIFRPSLVFGPEDGFFNRFAGLARVMPALPLFGGGKTRFQPVYVGDVAEAVLRALADPKTAGATYELGGPTIYTFRQLIELMLKEIKRKRCLVSIPFPIARLQARFLQILPAPPLTVDQVRLLERDNIVAPGVPGLPELGIKPTPVESVIPSYLDRFRPSGRFASAS